MSSLMVCALTALFTVGLAEVLLRILNYWSRRISVGTLYLQWMDDR